MFASLPKLSHLGIFMILTGLLFSRFCLSVGMLLLLANVLLEHPLRETLAKFSQQRDLLLLTSLFFLYFFTGLYSDDLGYFLERIQISLPLLFLPVAFTHKRICSLSALDNWLYLFFILMAGTALYSVTMTMYRQSVIGVSEYITTPVNHVRYCLMVSFSIFIGWHLYLRRRFRYLFERKLVLICTVMLIFCLHFLAVRSSLLGFYLVLLFGLRRRDLLLPMRLYPKKRGLRVVTLANLNKIKALSKERLAKHFSASISVHWLSVPGLLLVLGLCFQLPSLQRELKMTCHSITACFQGEIPAHPSDRGRLLSMKTGIRLGLAQPWAGTGLGDLKNEMKKQYAAGQDLSQGEGILLPHNQFVFYFTISGFIGLVWFGYSCCLFFKASISLPCA